MGGALRASCRGLVSGNGMEHASDLWHKSPASSGSSATPSSGAGWLSSVIRQLFDAIAGGRLVVQCHHAAL